MQYLKVSDPADIGLNFIKEHYELAFPLEERREWQALLGLIGKESDMQTELMTDGGKPVGFAICWIINGWMFIEHLVISSTERGKNYGSRVMQHYLQLAGKQLLLEVEPPTTEDAIRRIKFYERLGLTLLDYEYRQPSYHENGVSYPMRLMGNDPEIDVTSDLFCILIDQIKAKVYSL